MPAVTQRDVRQRDEDRRVVKRRSECSLGTWRTHDFGLTCYLVGDVLTPMGIRPFRPWSARSYSLELVYASDEEANERLSYLGAVALTLAIVAGVMAQDGGVAGIF